MCWTEKMARIVFYAILFLPCFRAVAGQEPAFACDVEGNPLLGNFSFCNRALDIDSRVMDLVGRLTLQEKVGFLGDNSPAVPRLGIPAYKWWSEALHGVSYIGHGTRFSSLVPGATSFPQVILTAASFNTTLFTAIGKAVSTEARAMYNVGLAGLTFWSPNVNIFRDPRWGRGQETPGEDPLLSSRYGSSYVRGLQDAEEPNKLKVGACCKHYTAYDVDNWKGVERYTFNAIVSKQDLEDTFNPPFKSCVLDGNVASVMCSYNMVNGKPTCADSKLLAGTIRGDWKLNGYIVADCDSVDVIHNKQHYTKSPEDAAAITIKSGLDLDCGNFLTLHSQSAIQAGKLTEADVDRAIGYNFATQIRLGFFDGNPIKLPYGSLGPSDVCTEENQELAREAARQGIVLLKNSNGSLPLNPSSVGSLAIIGPNINVTKTMIGNYEGTPCKYITPLQGLVDAASNSKVLAVPGCSNVACLANGFQLDPAKQAAAQADITILVVGADQSIERESFDRTDLILPGQQNVLVQEVSKAAKGLVILVVMSGGPFDISFAKNDDKISSILWVGYPGEAGGAAIADVIYGKFNPSGRLPVTWYPQSFAENVPMTDMRMRPDPFAGYPGRTYRFYTGEPVYAFGEGLSYTSFHHRRVKAPKLISIPVEEGHECLSQTCSSLPVSDIWCEKLEFDVHLRVKNTGGMAGGHTVLLFHAPPVERNAPRKHLIGFENMKLKPNAAGKVVFRVDLCKEMSLVDEEGKRKVALGTHLLHVGDLKHKLEIGVGLV